jgi:hypothetical protein
MASDSVVQIRIGAPGNVLEVEVGRVEVDVPRSVGYFGGLAAAVGLGLVEPLAPVHRGRPGVQSVDQQRISARSAVSR